MRQPGHFHLRFPVREIGYWAEQYSDDDRAVERIAKAVRQRRWLTRHEFLKVCEWKTPRSRRHCAKNSNEFVRCVTAVALSTKNERLRIEVLTLLNGVSWPTASVILHFMAPDRYPILDFRALWSLGIENAPVYDFEFWEAYTKCCWALAARAGVSMRELDRALWAYSSEEQPRSP